VVLCGIDVVLVDDTIHYYCRQSHHCPFFMLFYSFLRLFSMRFPETDIDTKGVKREKERKMSCKNL
jgi:hypothetical protein